MKLFLNRITSASFDNLLHNKPVNKNKLQTDRLEPINTLSSTGLSERPNPIKSGAKTIVVF